MQFKKFFIKFVLILSNKNIIKNIEEESYFNT